MLVEHRLGADGTVLRDALGRRVMLRGVNASGRSKMPPFAPFEFDGAAPYEKGYTAALDDYLDRVQALGVDVLRVPFVWEAVEPVKGQDDAAFLTRYDALLDAAWARRMWTVVDFHQDVYGRTFCGSGMPAWTLPATQPDGSPWPEPHTDCATWYLGYDTNPQVQAAFARFWNDEDGVQTAYRAMWQRMVERYAQRPGVIGFEVFNEPGHPGGDSKVWHEQVLSPFYASMVALIHALAPNTLVFLDTTGLSAVEGTTDLLPPPLGGVVLAPHAYDPAVYVGGAANPQALGEVLGKWKALGESWGVPVWVGEIGYRNDRADAGAAAEQALAAADAHGIGLAWWEFSLASTLWNHERLSLVDEKGDEHAGLMDAVARPYPRAIAGGAPTFSWTPSQRRFELVYLAESGGVSEVVLPQRAFPDGVEIELQGGCADPDAVPGALLIRADAPAEVRLVVRNVIPPG
ncbi:MAG: cellulase family glycosylhydrolase [Deltaproteobacteria bacterium]|nr:cellulase family glycosylhydrolase [Deltaproteobacteria bacterium]